MINACYFRVYIYTSKFPLTSQNANFIIQLLNYDKSISESSPHDLDEKKFTRFMQRKPIWMHFNISQNEYLSKSVEEKTSMIRQFYDYMDNGKNIVFSLDWIFF